MSFTAETRERARPAIPLAAMLDVLFLLLIFFMTASTLRQQELQIDITLPGAETAEAGSGLANQVPITITDQNGLYLGRREMASVDELRGELAALYEEAPGDTVVIRGGTESRYGLAIDVIDAAREVGFESIDAAVAKRLEE